jgi:plastocyanin
MSWGTSGGLAIAVRKVLTAGRRWPMRQWIVMGLSGLLALSAWSLQGNHHTQEVAAAARIQTVEMQASEFHFDPERITVKPGVIRFVVQNVGELRHVLTVEWAGGGGASIRIPPGQTRTLEVTLEQSGAYIFFCPLEDEGERGSLILHREKGMEGQLIVTKE